MTETPDKTGILRDFGRVVRAARQAHGHAQAMTASLLGIDQSLLSKFERGEREMGIVLAHKISILYQIELGALAVRSKRKRAAG